MFANGPGDLGSIPGRVIPKTLKVVLDTSLVNTQHYNIRIQNKWSNPGKKEYLSLQRYVSRVKWNNPGKGVAPFPRPRCSSY